MALTTGMRPSEYVALRWSDVDWKQGTATVSRTLEKGNSWKFAETKRARSRRVVKLQSWVVGLLDRATPSPVSRRTRILRRLRSSNLIRACPATAAVRPFWEYENGTRARDPAEHRLMCLNWKVIHCSERCRNRRHVRKGTNSWSRPSSSALIARRKSS